MFHSGDGIGPYTLIRILGRGAFGEVWLAERATSLLTTQVALKLPLDARPDFDAIRTEAQIWLKASGHTNVVPVLDAEVYHGQVVIASEYVAGGSLKDWLAQSGGKAPSWQSAVGMIQGVLAGLAHLHANQLIHRDLKPDNVLLQNNTPRLTDFGLSRILEPSGNTVNLAGTPGYMAPEAFRGQYSAASDLWAVGILLHELLVGALPYTQTYFYGLLLAITSDDAVELSPSVPHALRPVLEKALSKHMTGRYASALEMSAALTDAVPTASVPPSGRSAKKPPHNNLPVQVTSFIGREREMSEVKALLTRARMVTITAIGGIGKSRLSVQTAADLLDEFPDGVWFVELAALNEPSDVAQTVARLLNINEVPDEPVLTTLAAALQSRRLLLVLDNCEHLLAACADLASALLRCCTQVTLLASSREAMNITGEMVYPLPALSLPDPKKPHTSLTVSPYDAVRLFLDRASAVRRDFEVTDQNAVSVAQICHRLDGIPLALELAAARVRTLPIEEINSRLDNRFRLLTGGNRNVLPRQQTLRALIDWSYDLLNVQEQTLLGRLSVFAGGWDAVAAEAICAGGIIEDRDIFDVLTALADKSLVVCDAEGPRARYRLLETLRAYGREKLEAAGSPDVLAERHARYYAGAVEERASSSAGVEECEFEWLVTEADNLRAALAWFWRHNEVEIGARVSIHVRQFWTRKGWFREAYSNLQCAVEQLACVPDKELSARVLKDAGWFAYLLGDLGTAEQLTSESVERSIEAGATEVHANALNGLALILQARHDADRAEALFMQAIDLFRTLGNESILADYLMNLGFLQSTRGKHEAAQALFSEARTIYEKHSNPQGMAVWFCNQSDLALRRSDWLAARSFAEQSLERCRQIGYPLGIASALTNLAEAASRLHDHGIVEASVREAMAICVETNLRDLAPILLITRARSFIDQGQAGSAALLLAGAARLRMLLNIPSPLEEQHDIAIMESKLQELDPENLMLAAEAKLAGRSADEVIDHILTVL